MQKREDARHALEEEEEEDGEHKDNAEDDGKNVADSLKDSKSKKDDNFFAINNSEVRDSKGNLASMKEGGSKDQESGSKFEGGAKKSKFDLQKKPTAGMGNIMSGLTKSIKAKARVMKIESIYNVTSEKNESFKLSNDSACMGYAVFLKKEFLGMDLQYKQRSDVFMNSMIVHLI